MKFSIATFLLLLIFSISLTAQSKNINELKRSANTYQIKKGFKAVNLTIDYWHKHDFKYHVTGFSHSARPKNHFQIEYEHGVEDNLSLTGFLSYNRLSIGIPFAYNDLLLTNAISDTTGLVELVNSPECMMHYYSCSAALEEIVNVYSFGGKLKYHHSFFKKVNTYAFIGLGYNHTNRKHAIDPLLIGFVNENDLDIYVKSFSYYGGFGTRYFITSFLGLLGEIGFGNTNHLNIGISVNF